MSDMSPSLIIIKEGRNIPEGQSNSSIEINWKLPWYKWKKTHRQTAGILTTDKSINTFLYLLVIDLYGKGTGSKLNKTKTRGIWLGGWKDRKYNYRFCR